MKYTSYIIIKQNNIIYIFISYISHWPLSILILGFLFYLVVVSHKRKFENICDCHEKKFSGHSLALNWSYDSIKRTWNICQKLMLVFDTNGSPWESLNFFPYRKIIYGCAFFHIFPQILTNQLCLNQISGLDSRNIYPRPIKISLTVFYHAKLRAYDKIFGYVWKNTILEGTPNFFFKPLGFPLKMLNMNFFKLFSVVDWLNIDIL